MTGTLLCSSVSDCICHADGCGTAGLVCCRCPTVLLTPLAAQLLESMHYFCAAEGTCTQWQQWQQLFRRRNMQPFDVGEHTGYDQGVSTSKVRG